jgi:hypothetical protein
MKGHELTDEQWALLAEPCRAAHANYLKMMDTATGESDPIFVLLFVTSTMALNSTWSEIQRLRKVMGIEDV